MNPAKRQRRDPTQTALRALEDIALGDARDAVRLAFWPPETPLDWKKFDASQIAEVKRHSNGAIELKLINRVEAIKQLALLAQATQAPEGLPQLLQALGASAQQEDGSAL